MAVAVVTDSTADIPPDLAEARGLRVVPLTVTFGEESFLSGITLPVERFYHRLTHEPGVPTTSQPNPAWFEEAYADAADDGADAVVSVHLSSHLSGTCDQARRVAGRAPLPVTVVDSRQAGGALALAVFAAADAADAGAPPAAVAAAARRAAADTRVYFVVDSLDYLKRGGRLTGAEAVIGTVLRVKPILTVEAGRVAPLEKVRTWARAVERLGGLAGEHADGRAADVIVTHGLAPHRARWLWDRVEREVSVRERLETVIGPVVGSHLGPRTVGVALRPAPA
jgi:DegV family protein with EDD domain